MSMSSKQINNLKCMMSHASNLIWLTGGGLLRASRPDFSLALGFFRALMLEHPLLKIVVVDIDSKSSSEKMEAMNNIQRIVTKMLQGSTDLESEYCQEDGILYCNRVVPIKGKTEILRSKKIKSISRVPLKKLGQFELSIKHTGQFDTLHLQEIAPTSLDCSPHLLEIETKVVSLNAKDVHVIGARVDTRGGTSALELGGVVTRSNDSNFSPGDRVIAMVPHSFRRYEKVPGWACQKLRLEESFEELSTLPVAFGTAIYALRHRANLQPNESVLIHSGAGGMGQAAIQIAQLLGAVVYTTVGAPEKRVFVAKEFGIPESHIFNSRDSTFVSQILTITQGRGMDVVLNSLTDDLLHDGWEVCAEFGRFIEIGKKDILENSRLNMRKFADSTTFSAFDLTSLFYSHHKRHRDMWSSLIAEAVRLFRENKIRAISPRRQFDISSIRDAFRHFSSPNRMGKVLITMQDPDSLVEIVPQRYGLLLSPKKTYVLVGCLGGIGKSLSRHMLQQGARHFIFLSRTGADRSDAAQIIEGLRTAGASVQVQRGDVSILKDVKMTFSLAKLPIGGVI